MPEACRAVSGLLASNANATDTSPAPVPIVQLVFFDDVMFYRMARRRH
jgi:hypothetical protein